MSIKACSSFLGSTDSRYIKSEWKKAKQLIDEKDAKEGYHLIQKCIETFQASEAVLRETSTDENILNKLSLLHARLLFKAGHFLTRYEDYKNDHLGEDDEEGCDLQSEIFQLRLKGFLCCLKAVHLVPDVLDATPCTVQMVNFLTKINNPPTTPFEKIAFTVTEHLADLPEKLRKKTSKAIYAVIEELHIFSPHNKVDAQDLQKLRMEHTVLMIAIYIYKNFSRNDNKVVIIFAQKLTHFKMREKIASGDITLECYETEMRALLKGTSSLLDSPNFDIIFNMYMDFSLTWNLHPDQYYTFVIKLFQEINTPLLAGIASDSVDRLKAVCRIAMWDRFASRFSSPLKDRLDQYRANEMLELLKNRFYFFAKETPDDKKLLNSLLMKIFYYESNQEEADDLESKYHQLKSNWGNGQEPNPLSMRPYALRRSLV